MNRRRTFLLAGEFAGTLQGAAAFCAALPAAPASSSDAGGDGSSFTVGLASDSDVYAVYCKLHLARRTTQAAVSAHALCHYVLAGPRKPLPEPLPDRPRRGKPRPARGAAATNSASQAATPGAGALLGAPQAVIQRCEVDSRAPAVPALDVAQSVSPCTAAAQDPRPAPTSAAGGGSSGPGAVCSPRANGLANGAHEHALAAAQPAEGRAASQQARKAGESGGSSASQGEPAFWEVVVPVSTACQALTPQRLQAMLRIPGEARVHACSEAGGVVLALVDRDGTVAFSRLHAGLVPPAEGPPTAPT